MAYAFNNDKSKATAFTYIGENPISGTGEDDRETWKELGSGWCNISLNLTNGQPSQYGILLNYIGAVNEVHQIFLTQPNGEHWRRGTNRLTDTMPVWEKVVTVTDSYTKTESDDRYKDNLFKRISKNLSNLTAKPGKNRYKFSITPPSGYKYFCSHDIYIGGGGGEEVALIGSYVYGNDLYVCVGNPSTNTYIQVTAQVQVVYIKTGFGI